MAVTLKTQNAACIKTRIAPTADAAEKISDERDLPINAAYDRIKAAFERATKP